MCALLSGFDGVCVLSGEYDTDVSGSLGNYPTGGYVAIPLVAVGVLPAVYASDATAADQLLSKMLAGGWIDRYTRMIVVDWTVADTQVRHRVSNF